MKREELESLVDIPKLSPALRGEHGRLAEWTSNTFIAQVTTVNIAMWETRHSIVDWCCFKTQTLLKILKIRNRHMEEFYENLVLEENFSVSRLYGI